MKALFASIFKPLWNYFARYLICGIAIGWLIGMSVSPVVQSVVSAILAGLIATPAIVSQIRSSNNAQSSSDDTRANTEGIGHMANFFAILLLGVALGSMGGIWVRTHDYLSMSPKQHLDRLLQAGLSKEQAIDVHFSIGSLGASDKVASSHHQSVLFRSLDADECADCQRFVENDEYERLLIELRGCGEDIDLIARAIGDNKPALNALVRLLCKES